MSVPVRVAVSHTPGGDPTFAGFELLARSPGGGKSGSVPEPRDFGARQHGLSVANTRLFNVSLPGLACVCGKAAEAGAGCAWSFPFHPVGERRAGTRSP